MENTPSQSSCSTERLYWGEGTSILVSRRWFMRYRSRGRFQMGTLESLLPKTVLIPFPRVFLVTVHDPICTEFGNLTDALYGSFLPVPSNDLFPAHEPSLYAHHALPGAVVVKDERIVINKGRERVKIKVTNNGDRPIQVSGYFGAKSYANEGPQVGSHYHFIETNLHLSFDRARSHGKRLDIPAGTAVRFEPGDTKTVTLCAIAGKKKIKGGNQFATGSVYTEEIIAGFIQKGFGHTPEPGALEINEDTTIGREAYVSMFGPTVGDKVRLGDTLLWIQVERDETVYGDEVKFGGGLYSALKSVGRIVDRRNQGRVFARLWVKPQANLPRKRWISSSRTRSLSTGQESTRYYTQRSLPRHTFR